MWVQLMASAEDSSVKQLLGLPRSNDLQEQRTRLRHALRLARCSPSGYTYLSLCRQLADLSFKVGDKKDAICNLIESHAVVTRHRALMKYHRNLRKASNNDNIFQKNNIQFFGDEGNGYQHVMNILKDMPEEWTIVQLSCVVDATWRFGGINSDKWTPQLHIVRMECGSKPENEPLYLRQHPPPESSNYVILKEIKEMIRRNNTDTLKENKEQFWKVRSEVDTLVWNIISFMDSQWFVSISSFFAGRLSDAKLRKKIKMQVDKIISSVQRELVNSLSEVGHCLLLKAAENLDSLNNTALISIISRAINKARGTLVVKKIMKEFELLKKDICLELRNTKRNPVLLIIDEKLECLPFEQLEILKNNPISRIPSLHILHGLYTVHRSSIEKGFKVIDSSSGFYIINPDKDLNKTEERMGHFMIPRVPKWSGLIGQRLPEDEWCNVVNEKDIFVYMGHGGGGQYWNIEKVSGGIRSVSILFGCQSAGYKIMPSGLEVDATLQEYQAAACPCLVGMLWSVTDRDTDLLAQSVLNSWLPKFSEESGSGESVKGKKGRKKAAPGSFAMSAVVSETSFSEPELARAIIHGRSASRMLITKVGLITRGLPVYIK